MILLNTFFLIFSAAFLLGTVISVLMEFVL
jgi:hypothetical protein